MGDPSHQLPALIGKIAKALTTRPEYFVTHPTEVHLLRKLPEGELQSIAQQRGWRMVRKLGGRQMQFYNDVTVRPIESGRNQSL
ncbi:MAG: hypothetical protein M3Z64_03420 [Verrucomicrobiota bacterium]|nr:hypothetical protein [Verrucomicrobiota bacterium]